MFRVNISGQTFSYKRVGTSVKDSVNTEQVAFTLDPSWDELEVFACFKNDSLPEGQQEVHLMMPTERVVTIPWEVYTVEGALYVGALGMKNGTVVKPTIWVQIANVVDGVDPNGEFAKEATPSAVQQIMMIAQSVRNDADAGKFDGAPGKAPKIVNGNWYIYNPATQQYEDTGVYSGGDAPYIGANGNWFVGNQDTGVHAQGEVGKSAYQSALDNGFVGTEAEWLQSLHGADGTTPNVTVGTTTTAPAGTKASVTRRPDSPDTKPIFDFTIPQGANGKDGADPRLNIPATVGQTIKVTSVTPEGVIDGFEAVDASGGEWTVLLDKTIDLKSPASVIEEFLNASIFNFNAIQVTVSMFNYGGGTYNNFALSVDNLKISPTAFEYPRPTHTDIAQKHQVCALVSLNKALAVIGRNNRKNYPAIISEGEMGQTYKLFRCGYQTMTPFGKAGKVVMYLNQEVKDMEIKIVVLGV